MPNPLINYQKQSYVFHGSPNPDIKTLEPRPATDVDKSNLFNNDTAVFATVNPVASIIFACMSLSEIPTEILNRSWSVTQDQNKQIVSKIPRTWKQYVENNTGYVYVLDGTNFTAEGETEGGWQVKSRQPVTPTSKILVSFSDFEELGGKLIWKD